MRRLRPKGAKRAALAQVGNSIAASGVRESDGPEDDWAAAHEHELIGLPDDEACAMVRAAGFLPAVFEPGPGRALALLKVRRQVTMISRGGRITSVRLARPRR